MSDIRSKKLCSISREPSPPVISMCSPARSQVSPVGRITLGKCWQTVVCSRSTSVRTSGNKTRIWVGLVNGCGRQPARPWIITLILILTLLGCGEAPPDEFIRGPVPGMLGAQAGELRSAQRGHGIFPRPDAAVEVRQELTARRVVHVPQAGDHGGRARREERPGEAQGAFADREPAPSRVASGQDDKPGGPQVEAADLVHVEGARGRSVAGKD